MLGAEKGAGAKPKRAGGKKAKRHDGKELKQYGEDTVEPSKSPEDLRQRYFLRHTYSHLFPSTPILSYAPSREVERKMENLDFTLQQTKAKVLDLQGQIMDLENAIEAAISVHGFKRISSDPVDGTIKKRQQQSDLIESLQIGISEMREKLESALEAEKKKTAAFSAALEQVTKAVSGLQVSGGEDEKKNEGADAVVSEDA